MATVGEQLRAARLERGLTIEQVTKSTKIRPSLLQCLESGRYEALPGEFYAVSFAGQFAEAVGLNAHEVASAARSEVGLATNGPILQLQAGSRWTRQSAVRVAGTRIQQYVQANANVAKRVLVPAALIAGGIFLATLTYPTPRENTLDADLNRDPPRVSAAPATDQISRPVSAGDVGREAGQTDPRETGATAAAQGTPDSGTTGIRPAGGLGVEIRAKEPVWVRTVSDRGNEREVTLQPGQRLTFRADGTAYASLGNAGGASLIINGQDHGSLGESGQVRHVRITTKGWTRINPADF